MDTRKIVKVDVVEVQKRREPSKHYVYVIEVTWNDGVKNKIYRRYSRFFDFQNELLNKFPLEGGVLDPKERRIPLLPGKIFFGRSHIREVAEKRLRPIDHYCKALIALPSSISECSDVLEFFDAEPDDLGSQALLRNERKTGRIESISGPQLTEEYVAVAEYKKEDKWDLNLAPGTIVEVLEKNESGWWFVNLSDQQGWVPSTYLERKDGMKDYTRESLVVGEEKYISTAAYTSGADDEVSFGCGCTVDVLKKSLDGWWYIRYNGKEGWGPATYLQKAQQVHIQNMARISGVEIVGKPSDVSNLLKKTEADKKSLHDNTFTPIRENKSEENLSTFADECLSAISRKAFAAKKSLSIERGGSIRPPPRQSAKKKNSDSSASPPVIQKEVMSTYVTIASFEDQVGDGLSFQEGTEVKVIEKTDSGWWFVELGQRTGWVPATYIEKVEKDVQMEADQCVQSPDEEFEYDDDWYEEINYQGDSNHSSSNMMEKWDDDEDEDEKSEMYEVIDYGDSDEKPPLASPVDKPRFSTPTSLSEQKPQSGGFQLPKLPPKQNLQPMNRNEERSSTPEDKDSVDQEPLNELQLALKQRIQKKTSNADNFEKKSETKTNRPAPPQKALVPNFRMNTNSGEGSKFKPPLPSKSSPQSAVLLPAHQGSSNNNGGLAEDTRLSPFASSTSSQNSSKSSSPVPPKTPPKSNIGNNKHLLQIKKKSPLVSPATTPSHSPQLEDELDRDATSSPISAVRSKFESQMKINNKPETTTTKPWKRDIPETKSGPQWIKPGAPLKPTSLRPAAPFKPPAPSKPAAPAKPAVPSKPAVTSKPSVPSKPNLLPRPGYQTQSNRAVLPEGKVGSLAAELNQKLQHRGLNSAEDSSQQKNSTDLNDNRLFPRHAVPVSPKHSPNVPEKQLKPFLR